MKKEQKRYFLVNYCMKKRFIAVDTLEEVKSILKEVKKYNNRKSSKFLFGNIHINEVSGLYFLDAHLYRKLTPKMTISEIDNLTSSYNEKEIIQMYKNKLKTNDYLMPDINIAYFETIDSKEQKDKSEKLEVGIKYIPVLYSEDTKYLDKKYIKRCLYFHAEIKDYDFFNDLANEFCVYHFIGDEISKLYSAIDKCEKVDGNTNHLFIAANKLYDKFICEYEKDESLTRLKNGEYQISRRRLRDFGFFIKNYNIRKSKVKSPFKYNMPLLKSEYLEEENGQLKLRLN